MANQYKNKVVYNGTTLIDISDTTAVQSDVASGKSFYTASGEKVIGTGSNGNAISVVDTADSHGGTVRTITAVDISDTTAIASDVASGKYFYTANGTKTLGTASGSGSGGTGQTVTGTVSGSGTSTLQIPCDFAPDLIYVHGDMTGDASLRGCTLFLIIKDTYLQANIDSSSSKAEEYIFWNDYSITGYSGNDASMPHGEYASGNVIFYMVSTSSSARFPSDVTYTYKFIKWT